MSSSQERPRLLLGLLLALLCAVPSGVAAAADATSLLTGWKLQSGCAVKSTGERISSPEYTAAGWIDAIVPARCLARK